MDKYKKIGTLPLLPGGYQSFIESLREFLEYLQSTRETTVEQMENWTQDRFDIKQSSASAYVRSFLIMGMASRKNREELEISRFGQALSKAHDETVRRVIISLLRETYAGFEEILHLLAQSDEPMSLNEIGTNLQDDFDRWSSLSQYRERILWLRALDLAAPVDASEVFIITPRGQALFNNVAEPVIFPATVADHLERHLRAASTDGENSEMFEITLHDAFRFLGFDVQHIGGRGDTDIVLTASYTNFVAIIDAKARSGRLNQLDSYTINEHRKLRKSDAAMVVAPAFSGGKIVRLAEENQITLLPIDLLCQWLHWHEQTPFSYIENLDVFEVYGLLTDLPSTLRDYHQKPPRMSQLLVSVLALLDENHKNSLGLQWTAEKLHSVLVMQTGIRYTINEVGDVLDFLMHPPVSALVMHDDNTLHLTLNWQTLVARISRFKTMLQDDIASIISND